MFEPAEGGASPVESDSPDPKISEQEAQPKEEIQSSPKPDTPLPATDLNNETLESGIPTKSLETERYAGVESPQTEQTPGKTQENPTEQIPTQSQITPPVEETPVVLTPKDVEAQIGPNPLTSTVLEFVRERQLARARLSKPPNAGRERKAA